MKVSQVRQHAQSDVRKSAAETIYARLSDAGLLLVQDKEALNVVGLVAGETLRGSWWSHPKAHEIFAALSSLSEHPDVLFVKLLSGKVTLVHRKLWPALLAVVTEPGAWQVRRLSEPAQWLLASVAESPGALRAAHLTAARSCRRAVFRSRG